MRQLSAIANPEPVGVALAKTDRKWQIEISLFPNTSSAQRSLLI
jgi:hypothetical protein